MRSGRELIHERLWHCFRCPSCHTAIGSAGVDEIRCPACGSRYPVMPGRVPLLLVPEQQDRFKQVLSEDPGGRRMAEEYRRFGTWKNRVRAVLRPPSIVLDTDLPRRHSWIYDTHGLDTLVLSIGGGPGRENPRAINLNVDAFDSVDLVADGMNIPLIDQCVDTVTCNAVIEHVPDPVVLVSEMHRVLKPGGYLQMMIPFVFPFHAYPSDFQRFTMQGALQLTRAFEAVELAVLTGPTSAMLVLFREWLRLLVPGGHRPAVRTFLNGVSGWLTFPFKYLDLYMNRKQGAPTLAAAFYYLGKKSA
jgi:SAM-dependent methyltransferase